MVVRVLVVDDYQPWLFFVRSMLQDAWDFQVIGEASDGDEAVQKAIQLQPDLILLDIGLPTLNGIGAARLIREHDPDARILFLSEQHSQDVVREALNTGSGYVAKSYAPRELLPAIKTVLEGGRFVSACVDGHNFSDPEGKAKSTGETVGNRYEAVCYPDKTTFVEELARFVGTSLRNGSAIVVLASESHRVSVLQKLKSEGVDVATAIDQKRYFPLDIPDGFHTFQFAEFLATDAVKAARERNLRVGVA
ncbi:MAG TPA: response regulator transcription factor [Terriglobales bacterium]|jgi:DNA-binding NarL/FixJ family response regulator|nr:response regulator transcription factor [Terriglobales bacterium]